MNEFLTEYNLYQEYTLIENYSNGSKEFTTPYEFIGQTFEYDCQNEGAVKTFELELEPEKEKSYSALTSNIIPDNLFQNEKLDYTFKAIGKCKSCKTYHVDFLLHVYTNNPIVKTVGSFHQLLNNGSENTIQSLNTNIYIRKVGANPQIKIIPDKIITKYFDRETNKWYYKGLNALNDNYGIGSFAYFRRIIEKELINIIKDIKSLPDSHKPEIEELLTLHSQNPKISTIYDNIFQHLPNSLKSLGVNPIKLLYNQTSEGLHSLIEDECIEKAKSILALLNFVIKKINEERSEIKELREIVKSLK